MAFTALALSQQPGKLVHDTKLDLAVDPARFLGRALHLWDPLSGAGQLQNQAYGYLFPMGPFFLLGNAIGLPGWVVQRLWLALVLSLAALGVRRLILTLHVAGPLAATVGGLAYALSPRTVGAVGALSSEVLPLAVLPWVLLPLIHGSRAGSPRRAAARSALALMGAGAVNAAATLAILPVPVLLLLSWRRQERGRALARWWIVGVGLVSLWWLVPLLLLGRYSPPFAAYTESASATTQFTSLEEVLRGTSDWLGHLVVAGHSWWPAAAWLETSPWAVLCTVGVAVAGLFGLARGDLPQRRVWVGCALLGIVLSSSGFGEHLPTPFVPPLAGTAQALLDGPLAAFRNVHKFDPVLRLPLAVGVAHLLGTIRMRMPRRAVALLVAGLVAGIASPAFAGGLAPDGGFTQLPAWWQQTSSWLDRQPPGRALLVPAAAFGEYTWGRPLDDEPLKLLSSAPWTGRDVVPLGAVGWTRILDAITLRLDSGRGSAGFAPLLARSGITHLVVRNDLDQARTGALRPVVAHQAINDSPGLTRVAAFGPMQVAPADDAGLSVPYPAVEIYAVQGSHGLVDTYDAASALRVSGGPESVLQLSDRQLLAGRATVLAGDDGALRGLARAITDGHRRREVDPTQVRGGWSATLTPDDPLRLNRPARDITDRDAAQHLTSARLLGASSVRASSSASDPQAPLDRGPEHAPYAGVDNNPATSWISGTPAVGQWLELRLDRPVDVRKVRLVVVDDPMLGAAVTRVRISTDRGTVDRHVPPGGVTRDFDVPAGLTRRVRVTAVGTGDGSRGSVFGVRDLTVAGVNVTRVIVTPPDGSGGTTEVVALDRADGGTGACVRLADASALTAAARDEVRCGPGLARGQEESQLVRQVTTSGGTYGLSLRVRPRQGSALDALLQRTSTSPTRATASSNWLGVPRTGASAAFDGRLDTAWRANPADPQPSLTLTWRGLRVIDRLRLVEDGRAPASVPTQLVIVSPAGTRRARVLPDGTVRFAPLRTDRLTLEVVSSQRAQTTEAVFGSTSVLPVGIAEVDVPALRDLERPDPEDQPIILRCGAGPQLVIDGRTMQTTVRLARGDLLDLRDVPALPCVPNGLVAVSSGTHLIEGVDTAAVEVEGLTLTATPRPAAVPRAVLASDFASPVARTVRLGPGTVTLLNIHESANDGWTATLHGNRLAAVRIDGWQQGWLVPAGASGTVTLHYSPDTAFRRGLLAGLIAIVLVGAAAIMTTGRASHAPIELARPGGLALSPVLAASLVAGAVGAVIGLLAWLVRRRTPWWVVPLPFAASGTVLALISGAGTSGAATGPLLQAATVATVALLCRSPE
ncbi:MAG: hypothetical protein JWL79_3123 [Frankiales bacterium]|nr:hypothetical protein [Frankiales bacterium]